MENANLTYLNLSYKFYQYLQAVQGAFSLAGDIMTDD